MATARKLPSGSWRVLVFDGMVNGKRHYASITGATKKEAEWKAAQYLQENKTGPRERITVKDAVSRYIAAKTGILSPSTIRGYRQIEKTYLDDIGSKDIHKLTSEDLQRYVSGLALKVSAKTTANIYGLIVSSVGLFCPDRAFRVSLPKRIQPRRKSPSDDQIRALFDSAENDLKIAIALAAFGSLRRGEICALKHEDIAGNIIHVHADIVQNEHNIYEYKDMPKTSESVRYVKVPQQVIDLIGSGSGFILACSPGAITSSFIRHRDALGLDVRFHDLRHYYASVGAVLGVPDVYMSEFGGWKKGSGVMKEVYQNVMESAADRYRDTMIDHFSQIMQHEMQHKNEEPRKNAAPAMEQTGIEPEKG